MKKIEGIKSGNVLNISINGKLIKKICTTPEEAHELYKLVQIAKENPTDANINNIRMVLNEKTRIAYLTGLECDINKNEIYLAGLNTPIPNDLVEVIKDYHENGYPIDAIIKFWKLLMINPDKSIREELFNFIRTYDFVITDNGYFIAYKAVIPVKNIANQKLRDYVSNAYLHVKNDWKSSPSKYVVYINNDTKDYGITKKETAQNWSDKNKNFEIIGNLNDLNSKFADITSNENDEIVTYTDKHTQKMVIKLGVPVKMDRKLCDGDSKNECSFGLHVGATKYVKRFASPNDAILLCLINPAHVIAIPKYDNSKIRVCEYFPISLIERNNDDFNPITSKYSDIDYIGYEIEDLERLTEKIKANEKPIESAINSEEETRPMSELHKIINSRLIDLEIPFN